MRPRTCSVILLLAALLTACDSGAELTIKNNAPIPVIVKVTGLAESAMLSVSAGGTRTYSSKIASALSVTPLPSNDYIAEIQSARELLVQKSQKRPITEADVAEIENRLKSIDAKLNTLLQARTGGLKDCTVYFAQNTNCGAMTTYYGLGSVTIERRPDGGLAPQCVDPPETSKQRLDPP